MDGVNVPIDGMFCMACGHPWLLHHMHYGCNELACACQRPSTERESFNSHDWQARIRELEEALDVAAKAIADVGGTDDWPELTSSRQHGLFCGVEDRNLQDRYDGARYGYEDAMGRCHQFIRNAIGAAENNPTCADAIEKARKDSHVS